MDANCRDLYHSENGDRWSLVSIDERTVVRHFANAASGGASTDYALLDFLRAGGLGPEEQELLRLIGTLMGGSS